MTHNDMQETPGLMLCISEHKDFWSDRAVLATRSRGQPRDENCARQQRRQYEGWTTGSHIGRYLAELTEAGPPSIFERN